MSKTVLFAVSSRGNMEALNMCLLSVAMQMEQPDAVHIRLEGEFLNTSNFYFEQVCSLLRLYGVPVSLELDRSSGVRNARNRLLRAGSAYDFLWMGDEDVVYDPECLAKLLLGYRTGTDPDLPPVTSLPLGYIQGTKPDVNNRRNYPDFHSEVRSVEDAEKGAGYNQLYVYADRLIPCESMDTGNVLIDMQAVTGIKGWETAFSTMTPEYNSGGEDTLFALWLRKGGFAGAFMLSAQSVHLEKPAVAFSEFAARKNYVAAVAKLNGYDELAARQVFPSIKPCIAQ